MWTKATIVAQLQQYHRAGVNLNAFSRIQKRNPGLASAAFRLFGSYANAMTAAGIDYHPTRPLFRDGEEVVQRIRARKREGKELNSGLVERKEVSLWRAGVRFFGNWDAALTAAGIDASRVRRSKKWDRKMVLNGLRHLHSRGKDLSTTQMSKSTANKRLMAAAISHYGSYKSAMKAAGIDYSQVKRSRGIWTRENIIEKIQQMHAKGMDLSTGNALKRKSIGRVMAAGFNHFGTWRSAIEAAGIDYSTVKKYAGDWNEKKILSRLKELRAAGADISPGRMAAEENSLYSAAMRWHGSYRMALKKAGIDYASVRRMTEWSPELVLRQMKTMRKMGEDLSPKKVARTNDPLYGAAVRYFGSYRAALGKAGIDWLSVVKNRSWTKQDVIAGLRKLRKEDKELTSAKLLKEHSKLYMAGFRLYGGIGKALSAAGVGPLARQRPPSHWNELMILDQLRELDRAGEDLRYRSMSVKHSPLYWAARKLFGSYGKAVVAAGIDYERVVQRELQKERADRASKVSRKING